MQRKRIPASFNKTGTPFFHDVIATKIKTLFQKKQNFQKMFQSSFFNSLSSWSNASMRATTSPSRSRIKAVGISLTLYIGSSLELTYWGSRTVIQGRLLAAVFQKCSSESNEIW